jgi:hypothetical protein
MPISLSLCSFCHFIFYCFSTFSRYKWTYTSLHIADVIMKPSPQISGRKTSYPCWGLYGLLQSLQANISDYVTTISLQVITNLFLTNHFTIRRCVFSDTFNKQRSCCHLGRHLALKLKFNVARLTCDIVHCVHPERYGEILGPPKYLSRPEVSGNLSLLSWSSRSVLCLPLSLCVCLSLSLSGFSRHNGFICFCSLQSLLISLSCSAHSKFLINKLI